MTENKNCFYYKNEHGDVITEYREDRYIYLNDLANIMNSQSIDEYVIFRQKYSIPVLKKLYHIKKDLVHQLHKFYEIATKFNIKQINPEIFKKELFKIFKYSNNHHVILANDILVLLGYYNIINNNKITSYEKLFSLMSIDNNYNKMEFFGKNQVDPEYVNNKAHLLQFACKTVGEVINFLGANRLKYSSTSTEMQCYFSLMLKLCRTFRGFEQITKFYTQDRLKYTFPNNADYYNARKNLLIVGKTVCENFSNFKFISQIYHSGMLEQIYSNDKEQIINENNELYLLGKRKCKQFDDYNYLSERYANTDSYKNDNNEVANCTQKLCQNMSQFRTLKNIYNSYNNQMKIDLYYFGMSICKTISEFNIFKQQYNDLELKLLFGCDLSSKIEIFNFGMSLCKNICECINFLKIYDDNTLKDLYQGNDLEIIKIKLFNMCMEGSKNTTHVSNFIELLNIYTNEKLIEIFGEENIKHEHQRLFYTALNSCYHIQDYNAFFAVYTNSKILDIGLNPHEEKYKIIQKIKDENRYLLNMKTITFLK